MNKIMRFALGLMNSIVIILAISSMQSACAWIFYQPKVPEQLKRFKR